MYITKLVLKGYKRFSLKQVDEYTFIPKSNLTIFNWGNGCGKSSLLQQLNPLPADLKRDFHPDGYKIIELDHLNKHYILTSKDGKHSFIEDEVELNQGGTKKAQLELVESIFKITPNNIGVIAGTNKFSLMSPSERKNWLTKISTVDYIFPISIYNKLLEKKRDATGVIKHAKANIANIEKSLLESNNIEAIKKEEQLVREIIEDLLKAYTSVPNTENLNDVLNRLNKKCKFIETYYPDLSSIKFKDGLETEIDRVKGVIKTLDELEESIVKEISNLKKTSDPKRLEELKKHLEVLSNKIKDFKHGKTLEDFERIYDKLFYIKNLLELDISAFESIREDTEIDLSKLRSIEDYNRLRDNYKTTIDTLQGSLKALDNKDSVIDSLVNSDIHCTNCNSILDIKGLKDKNNTIKQDIIKKISDLKPILIRIEKELKIATTISMLKTKLERYSTELLEYTEVFLKDIGGVVRFDNIKLFLELINNVLRDRDYYISIFTEVKDITEKIKQEEMKVSLEKSVVEERLKNYNNDLEKLKNKREEGVKKLKQLTDSLNYFNKFKELRESLKDDLKSISNIKKYKKQELVNETIELAVKELKIKLSSLNKLIESRNDLEKQAKLYYKTIEDKEQDNEVLNLLLDILSPTNGLIAKSINSFIGKFISDVNLIINTVWSYKMKLLPCEVSEDSDLDYRFKVEVNDSFIIEDISKLSSSMQEIVDLSFRLVFIKYMEFHGIPIMLDEFGRTMDPEHRIQSFNMIDTVICSTYDQVFLVSHFEEMYGRFKNADYPILE